MKRRRRIAVAENVLRGLAGEPQLVPVGQTVRPPGLAHERDIAQPVVVRLGPAVVRTRASLELKVSRADGRTFEVTGPNTPEYQAAALATTATGMMVGGWIGEVAFHDTGYVVIGALAGWVGAVKLWNRWVRESRAP